MKKSLLLLLLLNLSIVQAAFIENNYFFDQSNAAVSNVQGLVLTCGDTQCNTVQSTIFNQNSGSANKLIIPFPATPELAYYGEYFYRNCFIPKEFLVISRGSGEITYNNILNKAEQCRSPIALSVVNQAFANEPVQININADITTTTQSAFRENAQPPFFTPSGFDDHYSAQTAVTVTVKNASGVSVFSQPQNLNLFMDTSAQSTFIWLPTEPGTYSVEASTDVTDCQCSSKISQISTKTIEVLPARPLNQCYTVLNNLSSDNLFPQEGQTVTFRVEKLSNYADNAGVKTPLPTNVHLQVFLNGTLPFIDSNLPFPANPDEDKRTVTFDVAFPNEGQYGITLTGTAQNCPAGASANIRDIITNSIAVSQAPTFSLDLFITSAANSQPVPGAAIEMSNGFSGVTDASGHLRLSGFASGNYVYTITHPSFNTLSDDVIITTSDLTLNLQLFPKNIAPVILPIPDQVQNKGQAIVFDLDNFGDDVDDPQATLVWTVAAEPPLGAVINAATHVITIAPNTTDFVGQSSVTVSLTDPDGASDSESFSVLFTDCVSSAACDDSDAHTQDICLNPATPASECQHTAIACLNDNECGNDGFLGNAACNAANDVEDTFQDFSCINPGLTTAFCNATNATQVVDDCTAAETCENSACVAVACFADASCDDGNASTEDICVSPGRGNSSCQNNAIQCFSETDCGADGFLGNASCDANGNVSDTFRDFSCSSPGTGASACSSADSVILFDDCSSAEVCENALCQGVTCFGNADCNDGNVRTEDVCVDPGTANSTCQNNAIQCLADAECGADGFIGIAFCDAAGNVSDTFRTFSCANPGTNLSSCSSADAAQTFDDCTVSETCENALCQDVACFGNAGCADGDVFTEDLCLGAGTANSSCDHRIIQCFAEADCGADGFLGSTFCDAGGNVSDTFRDFSCSDPGSNLSSCLFADAATVFDGCDAGQVCENAACQGVDCFAEADCGADGFLGNAFCDGSGDVSDTFRDFSCNNAGTANSTCSQSDSTQLFDDCILTEACENALCQGVTCFGNADCNDGNARTEDICLGAGTANSTCQNNQIQCLADAECGADGFIGIAFCDASGDAADIFRDFTCNNAGTNSSTCSAADTVQVTDDCTAAEACENGACNTVACFTEADCGTDGLLGNSFCDGEGNVSDTFRDFSCSDAGTANASCAFADAQQLIDDCTASEACENAACMPISCFSEADCGIDGFLGLPFCSTNTTLSDTFRDFSCNGAGSANASCAAVDTVNLTQACAGNEVCEADQCSTVACFTDAECDDNNAFTEDRCINPGTANGFCSHQNILCLTNADCGRNEAFGGFFCQGNNLMQTFRSFLCVNPGAANASCAVSGASALIETCRHGCSEGECLTKPQPDVIVEHIELRGLTAPNEYFATVTLRNNGEIDLKEMRMSAVLQEAGYQSKIIHFDLDRRGSISRKLFLDLPELEPGLYDLRFVLSNDKIRRVIHREIRIE